MWEGGVCVCVGGRCVCVCGRKEVWCVCGRKEVCVCGREVCVCVEGRRCVCVCVGGREDGGGGLGLQNTTLQAEREGVYPNSNSLDEYTGIGLNNNPAE